MVTISLIFKSFVFNLLIPIIFFICQCWKKKQNIHSITLKGGFNFLPHKLKFSFSNVVLTNISLGYNYHNSFPCRSGERFSFTPNRIKNQKSRYKFIYNMMNFYPYERSKNNIQLILRILKFISTMPHNPNVDEVYFIFTVNSSIINALLEDPNIWKAHCQSWNNSCEIIKQLDYGYHFLEYFNKKESFFKIPIIYSNIQQNFFDSSFLNSNHRTQVHNYPFTGYYAASFGLLVYLPFHLHIYDFFDYVGRIDIDFRNFQRKYPLHPYDVLLNSSIFLYGCKYTFDAPFVSVNVFKNVFMFMNQVAESCGKFYYSSNFFPNGFFPKENGMIPGAYQVFWLGLYSSIEVKIFTQHFISFPDGIKKNRWGDQQYFLLTLALFSNKNHFFASSNNLFCRHQELGFRN